MTSVDGRRRWLLGATRIERQPDRLIIRYRWPAARAIGVGVFVALVPPMLWMIDVGFVEGEMTLSAPVGLGIALVLGLFQETRIDIDRTRLRATCHPLPLAPLSIPVGELTGVGHYSFSSLDMRSEAGSSGGAHGQLVAVTRDRRQHAVVRTSLAATAQLDRMKQEVDTFLGLPPAFVLASGGTSMHVWRWVGAAALGVGLTWALIYGPGTNPELQAFWRIREQVTKDLAASSQWTASNRLLALDLSGAADAGDDTVVHLRAMAHLERLDLRGTSVSDASLDHLASLSTLRYLDVRGTRITVDGASRLARALTDCQVLSGPMATEDIAPNP